MVPQKFASLVRYYTKTNSSTFTDSDILLLANALKDDFCQKIEQNNEGYFDMEMYADLIAGQRQYSLPDELLNRIQQVEIKLLSTWSDYKVCTEERLNLAGNPTDEEAISTKYTDSDPRFLLKRKSLYVLTNTLPESITDGLKLWCSVYPTDLSDLASTIDMAVDPTSDGVGIPRQVHELLARAVSINYKLNRDRPLPLNALEQKFEADFALALEAIQGTNTDRNQEAQLPYDDGTQY